MYTVTFLSKEQKKKYTVRFLTHINISDSDNHRGRHVEYQHRAFNRCNAIILNSLLLTIEVLAFKQHQFISNFFLAFFKKQQSVIIKLF